MSKYDNYYRNAYSDFDYDEEMQLKLALMEGEQIIWKGKPKKSAQIMNGVFSKMFPFTMMWLCFDLFFILTIFGSGAGGEMLFFIVPFFALHMMPVWMWIGGIIKSASKCKFKAYALTDMRVLIKTESVLFNSINYEDILNVAVRQGFADRMTNVGDIYIDVANAGRETIVDIEEFAQVQKILQDKVYELRQAGYRPSNAQSMGPVGMRGYYDSYDMGDTGASAYMYGLGNQAVSGSNYGMGPNRVVDESQLNQSQQFDNFNNADNSGRTQYMVNGEFVNPPGYNNYGNNSGDNYYNNDNNSYNNPYGGR